MAHAFEVSTAGLSRPAAARGMSMEETAGQAISRPAVSVSIGLL
jgi:hypothetical protein